MSEIKSSRAVHDFLAEAEEIIEKLNLDLIALADRAESADFSPELLNEIFRGAHSLKGLAGMVGFDDIGELSHHMENLLDGLRLGKVQLTVELIDTLFVSLEVLLKIVHGKGKDELFTVDLTTVLSRIAALGKTPASPDESLLTTCGVDAKILDVLTEYEEHRLLENLKQKRHLFRVNAVFNLSSFDQDLSEISELLKQQGEIISTLPSSGDFSDKIAFQLLYGTRINRDEVVALLGHDEIAVIPVGDEQPSQEFADAAQAVAVSPASAPSTVGSAEAGSDASARSISRTVRVDIDKLDYLMNIVGDLVLAKGAIATIADQLRAQDDSLGGELQKATRSLERRLDELRDGVMDVRMVPVGQLFEKMARIVRRVANEHGKKVVLEILGGDTELDKMIVEDLSDPLMHIIRNSIDHGIERPEERVAKGKPEKGMVKLQAMQRGNHVVIAISDDGRGIDPDLIHSKAIKKGLVGKDTVMSRDAIFDLLFTPGFSTRDEVSDLSGRGVGMDVVKTNIGNMSGMIEIDSTVNAGTTMSLTLPITLAIIKALIVKVCGRTYAIPINSVLETLMIERRDIRTIERREVVELRKITLPLLRLGHIFNLEEKKSSSDRLFIAVVGLAEKRMGIVVDELIGQQDVVIKSLGSVLSFVRGVAGAADMGNQKTILVLDVGGLLSDTLRGDGSIHV
ncbi:MAG: chemotaxis protein CheA [Desulfuromonadales bacterium]|nr:chemotaxis protein CheA [Desulfuromonadales bacterium]